MDALHGIKKVLKRQELFLKIIGFNVFDKYFKPNFLTFIAILWVIIFSGVMLRSLILYKNDFQEFSLTVITMPYIVQGAYRMFLCIKSHKELRANKEKTLKIYRLLLENCENEQIFIKYSRIFVRFTNILTIFFSSFLFVYLLIPTIIYLKSGETKLVFNCHLPDLKIGRKLDFALNYILQAFSGVIASFGLIGCHTYYLSPIISICVQIDYLKDKLVKISTLHDFSKLKDFIWWHCELLR